MSNVDLTKILKEGDEVTCVIHGEGVVSCVVECDGEPGGYCISVRDVSGHVNWYTADGKSNPSHLKPSLYPAGTIMPTPDWPKTSFNVNGVTYERGELVAVKSSEGTRANFTIRKLGDIERGGYNQSMLVRTYHPNDYKMSGSTEVYMYIHKLDNFINKGS